MLLWKFEVNISLRDSEEKICVLSVGEEEEASQAGCCINKQSASPRNHRPNFTLHWFRGISKEIRAHICYSSHRIQECAMQVLLMTEKYNCPGSQNCSHSKKKLIQHLRKRSWAWCMHETQQTNITKKKKRKEK